MDKYQITLTWGTAFVYATSYAQVNDRYVFYVGRTVKASYLVAEVVSIDRIAENGVESLR